MRRRMMMGVELLPAGYRQLDYIKNPSNAYINTGIAPTSNTGVEVKFSIPPNNNDYNIVFGCRENAGNTRFFMCVDWNSSTKTIVFGYNSNIAGSSRPIITNSDIGKVCIASMNKYNDKSYYYDGIKVGTTPSTLASITRPIFLFAQNAHNGIINPYKGEIYSVLVTEGTNKIAFYVPAERLSDNKVGVYDIISKQFLTSPNGTDFIGGFSPTPIDYLKSIGCKLWLPLNSEYGLEAAIGNTRIVNVVNNAVTINSSLNIGEFILGNADVPVAKLTTDWTSADFPNNEWTMFSQGRRHTTSNYRGVGSAFKFPTTETGKYRFVQICFNENVSVATNNWTNDKIQTAICLIKNIEQSSMSRKLYWCEDGGTPVLKIDDTLSYLNLYAIPYQENIINIACHSNPNKRVFLKNVMIFNRHLTEDEMKKVLQII